MPLCRRVVRGFRQRCRCRTATSILYAVGSAAGSCRGELGTGSQAHGAQFRVSHALLGRAIRRFWGRRRALQGCPEFASWWAGARRLEGAVCRGSIAETIRKSRLSGKYATVYKANDDAALKLVIYRGDVLAPEKPAVAAARTMGCSRFSPLRRRYPRVRFCRSKLPPDRRG